MVCVRFPVWGGYTAVQPECRQCVSCAIMMMTSIVVAVDDSTLSAATTPKRRCGSALPESNPTRPGSRCQPEPQAECQWTRTDSDAAPRAP